MTTQGNPPDDCSQHDETRSALLDDTAWMAHGLCAQTDPEAFYPEKGQSTAAARRVCAACPVQPDCLDYALAHDERYGIWGGTTEMERRPLRRARRHALLLPELPDGGEAA